MPYRFIARAIVAASLVAPALSACSGSPSSGAGFTPDTAGYSAAASAIRRNTTGFNVVYTFSGLGSYGRGVDGGVTIDKKGNIFGITTYSAIYSSDHGTLFELAPSGSSYTETNIASFDGSNGESPWNRPIEDASGNLYVTTSGGGASTPYGTVNKFTHGSSGWTQSAINVLGSGSTDGRYPYAAPVEQNGTLYIPTTQGGYWREGAIYALSANSLTGSVIYSFQGPDRGDLGVPYTTLVAGPNGVLYGTAESGGKGFGTQGGGGGIYTLSGGTYTFVFGFPADKKGLFPEGRGPESPVVVDKSGNIYGTTEFGGSYAKGTCAMFGCGVVFKVTKAGVLKVLHRFGGGKDGYEPLQGLVLKGNTLYGTTYVGGTQYCGPGSLGCGTLFKIGISGSGYKILHTFVGTDGSNPYFGSMTLVGNTLYGTTETGYTGVYANGGVVFTYTI